MREIRQDFVPSALGQRWAPDLTTETLLREFQMCGEHIHTFWAHLLWAWVHQSSSKNWSLPGEDEDGRDQNRDMITIQTLKKKNLY